MNEFTQHFMEKPTDKILVELTLTGNPDEQIKELFKVFKQEKQLLPGVKINEIYFKGYDINKIVHRKRKELVEGIQKDVAHLLSDLTKDHDRLGK